MTFKIDLKNPFWMSRTTGKEKEKKRKKNYFLTSIPKRAIREERNKKAFGDPNPKGEVPLLFLHMERGEERRGGERRGKTHLMKYNKSVFMLSGS